MCIILARLCLIEAIFFFDVITFKIRKHLEMVLLKLIDLALVPVKKILLNLSVLANRILQMRSFLIQIISMIGFQITQLNH